MRKIYKITNIALIFTLTIGVFLCQDLYALRVPLDKGYVRSKEILKELEAEDNNTFSIRYDYMCISLTNYCPIQCPMCFMQATKFKDRSTSLSNNAIDKLLGYLKEKKIRKLSLTGGEPTAEMEKLLRFVMEADVDSITIFTSGYFAVNDTKTEKVLDAISQALGDRKNLGKKPIKLFIRVSVDKFHFQVPIKSIVRIIKLFEKYHDSKYKDMSLGLKGILTDDDPIPSLVGSLGGEVSVKNTDNFFLFEDVVLKSGFTFNIEYTELKLIEETLGKDIKAGYFDKIYPKRLERKDKILIGANQNGIALSVSHDGTISPHEYLVKSLALANIEDDNFDKEVEARLVSDLLIIVLTNIGLAPVVAILNEINPDIAKRALEANNQFLVISQLMAEDKIREYVYKRLRRLAKDNGWLQRNSNGLIDLNSVGFFEALNMTGNLGENLTREGLSGLISFTIENSQSVFAATKKSYRAGEITELFRAINDKQILERIFEGIAFETSLKQLNSQLSFFKAVFDAAYKVDFDTPHKEYMELEKGREGMLSGLHHLRVLLAASPSRYIQLKKILRRYASLIQRKDLRILIIGPGFEQDIKMINETFPGIIVNGLDNDPNAISWLKTRQLNARLFQGDARHMPFENGSFDLIIANHVLRYIAVAGHDSLIKFANELKRVISDDGIIIMENTDGAEKSVVSFSKLLSDREFLISSSERKSFYHRSTLFRIMYYEYFVKENQGFKKVVDKIRKLKGKGQPIEKFLFDLAGYSEGIKSLVVVSNKEEIQTILDASVSEREKEGSVTGKRLDGFSGRELNAAL